MWWNRKQNLVDGWKKEVVTTNDRLFYYNLLLQVEEGLRKKDIAPVTHEEIENRALQIKSIQDMRQRLNDEGVWGPNWYIGYKHPLQDKIWVGWIG